MFCLTHNPHYPEAGWGMLFETAQNQPPAHHQPRFSHSADHCWAVYLTKKLMVTSPSLDVCFWQLVINFFLKCCGDPVLSVLHAASEAVYGEKNGKAPGLTHESLFPQDSFYYFRLICYPHNPIINHVICDHVLLSRRSALVLAYWALTERHTHSIHKMEQWMSYSTLSTEKSLTTSRKE
jgi:hypothetical protein